MFDSGSFKDDNFKEWVDSLGDIIDSSMTAGDALNQYKSHLESTANSTSTFSKITKVAGDALKSIASFGINMLATYAVTKVFEIGAEAIYNWIHATDIAIEKGKEAGQKIDEIRNSLSEKQKFNDSNAERFEYLQNGVNPRTNQNISLTNDEYSEYLSLCNQIAEVYPSLVQSYDSQGNAILNLGSSAQTATQQLQEMLDVDKQLANLEISDNLQTEYKGKKAEADKLQQKIDEYKTTAEENKRLIKVINETDESSIYNQLDNVLSGESYWLEIDSTNKELIDNIKNILRQNGFDIDEITSSLYDSNGDGIDDKQIINFLNLPNEEELSSAMANVKSCIKTELHDLSISASESLSENIFAESSIKKEIENVWKDFLPSVVSSLETNPNYLQLGENIQNSITNAISNIDYSKVPDNMTLVDYLKQTYLYPISEVFNDETATEVQDSIMKVFSPDMMNLPVNEYSNKVKELLEPLRQFYINAFDDEVAGNQKFQDFLITFGFKIQTEDGQLIDNATSLKRVIKDKAFGKGENPNALNLDSLTYQQMIELEEIVNTDSYGGTIKEAIDKVQADTKKQIESEPITFSSILADDSDDGLSKKVDNFQSKISSIQSALDSLRTGEDINLTDLTQQFTELNGQTGNLEESLVSLKSKELGNVISDIFKVAKEKGLSISEMDNVVEFIQNLIKESDIEIPIAKNAVISALMPSAVDTIDRKIVSDTVNSIFDDIDVNVSPLQKLSNEMTVLQSGAKKVQDAMSLKDALGIKETKSDYRDLISNSRDQVKNLQLQNEELQKSLVGLNENSDSYKSITSQIESNVSAINEARIAQLEWNKAAKELDYQPNEGLMAYNEAKQSRNAGDNYLDMLSAAKEAQEARKKGLVGTDDFKTVAKMFSPNGMDDYQNWDENYSKIQRYFTEGDTGAKNFLNDLSQITRETENGTIALAEFDDSTKTWSYNIDDVQASADALGISFEAFLAIMGRLQDYGFSNDFFSSIEDGQDHLGSLYSDLAQAETELIRLQEERDNGNATVTDTVLRSQEAKIESIKSSILSTQDLIDQLMNRQVSDYEAETQSALRTAQSMIDKMGESDNEVTKKRIQNDLESFAAKYGITLQYDANTGELLGLSQSNQEILQEAMDKDPIEIKYKTPDLTNRPQVSSEKMQESGWNVNDGEYATVYSSAYSNEDETKTIVVTPILPNGDVLDENSLRGYADKLLNGEEIDAQVHLATFEGEDSVQQANNYSDALHAVQEAYYSEDEELQSLISSLGEYNKAQLESIQLADDSYDETYAEAEKSIDNILSTLGLSTDQASALYTVLEQMGLIKPSVEYEADTSNVDEAISEIESSNPTVNVDTDAYQKIQVAQNLLSTINGENFIATVSVESSAAQTELDNIVTELSQLDQNKLIEIGFKPSQGNTITAEDIRAQIGTVEIPVSYSTPTTTSTGKVDSSSADNYTPDSKTIKVKTGSVDDSSVKGYQPESKVVPVRTGALNTSSLNVSLPPIYQDVITRKIPSGGTASGTLMTNGKSAPIVHAHANGTAYNVLNLRAHASGTDVALKHNENALVNELGNEALIRDGKLYEIPGGTHMQSLKRGDVVINAAQWSEIKKYGSTNTFAGKAYATGTFGQIPLAHAYANNNGSFAISTSSTSSSSSSTTSNTDAVNANTVATNKNTKSKAKATKTLKKLQESFSKIFDWIEVKLDRLQRDIDMAETKADNSVGYQAKNANLSNAQSITKALIQTNNKGATEYFNYAKKVQKQYDSLSNKQFSKDNKKAFDDAVKIIQNGGDLKISSYNEDVRAAIEEYQKWYDKGLECQKQAEELQGQLRELAQTKFDNIADQFDNVVGRIEHTANMLNESIDQAENKGYVGSTKFYEALVKNEKSSINQLVEERKRLTENLRDSMASGIIKKGSTEWYEMQSQIDDVTESIQEANGQLIEYADNIRQIKWDLFDRARDSVSNLVTESEFLINLMSNDKLYTDEGKMTEEGLATFGLYGMKYDTYMKEADTYRDEMKRINAELANDPSNTKLIDRKNELLKLQQESIQAAEDEKEAIKNLVEDGINKELESLKKLIDKYNEALDSQKDLQDYQRDVADSAKEIASLQKKISAYANDTSDESKMQIQKWQNELEEKQQNLQDKEYDHFISDQKELLDDLYTEYEDILNQRLDNVDELIRQTIDSVNANANVIRDTLETQTREVGYQITSEMAKVWGDDGSVGSILTSYNEKFSNYSASVLTAIGSINEYVKALADKADKNAQTEISNDTSDTSGTAPIPSNTGTSGNTNTNNSNNTANQVSASSTQGNGKIEVGDKITITSNDAGAWKYSSKAKSKNKLNKMLKKGASYYVGDYNSKDPFPVHLYSDKERKKSVGWVRTKWLKGYADGVKKVKDDQLAVTQENGLEIVNIPKQGMLTPLTKGSTVFNNEQVQKLYEWSKDDSLPTSSQLQYIRNKDIVPNTTNSINNSNNNNTVKIELPNVVDTQSLLNELRNNKSVRTTIQDLTIGRITGMSDLQSRYGR